MANDPAFLFYPGDYLRDTQCLSEKSQVAYDRIMCEHMRNICITQEQLNFFTKRLSDEEKKEVKMLLTKTAAGYQISWVAESICKRREYSDSRRKNRTTKPKNISKTYDSHMENEIEDVIENVIRDEVVNKNDKRINEFITNQRWKEEFCMAKNIEMPALEKLQQDFISDTNLKRQYVDSYPKYFTNWYNLKQNGTHKQSNATVVKLGTSEARNAKGREW